MLFKSTQHPAPSTLPIEGPDRTRPQCLCTAQPIQKGRVQAELPPVQLGAHLKWATNSLVLCQQLALRNSQQHFEVSAAKEDADLRTTAQFVSLELELELIQTHMTQKPVLRGEVDARALRV